MRNGCAWNHAASFLTIKTMPQHLKKLGYRVGIAGKVHVTPESAFPFEKVKGFDSNCPRNPTRPHDVKPITRFMERDKSQPFCLVVALTEPNVPWVMGDASKYPANKLKLPSNIADISRTRQRYGKYLAEITDMDGQVDDILQALDRSGQADTTLVIFSSEQGTQFPGCKWTNYDTGLHTALIARWPGVVAGGNLTDAIVQWVNVLPTFLDAAGGEPASGDFDGTSFLPVLAGKKEKHRKFAYGVHNNVPEGPPYPIRTVTDGRYRYIRNLRPDEIYIEKHLMGPENQYWASWLNRAYSKPEVYDLVKRYMMRPAEELYDLRADPFELKNLVDHPDLADTREKLSRELDRWLKEQGDPGIPQDTQKALDAARKGKHLYGKPTTAK